MNTGIRVCMYICMYMHVRMYICMKYIDNYAFYDGNLFVNNASYSVTGIL